MNTQISPVRPPYVRFERQAQHDSVKSNELGYRVSKDVDMALIMQPGSKDEVVKKAEDWLKQIKQKVIDATPDAYPPDWVDGFHKKYEMWKQGLDAPLNGTSVREWNMLSRAQAENFVALHILTIEDVAAMSEDAMQRFGMGSRELKEKAQEWMKSKTSAAAVFQENENLKRRIAELEEKFSKMEEPKKRGRKPKLLE